MRIVLSSTLHFSIVMYTLDTKLRRLRELYGYAQSTVAFELNIDQSSYGRLEQRTDYKVLEQLSHVAAFYGFTLVELLTCDTDTLIQKSVSRDTFVKSKKGGDK